MNILLSIWPPWCCLLGVRVVLVLVVVVVLSVSGGWWCCLLVVVVVLVCPGTYWLGGHSVGIQEILQPTVHLAIEPFSGSPDISFIHMNTLFSKSLHHWVETNSNALVCRPKPQCRGGCFGRTGINREKIQY